MNPSDLVELMLYFYFMKAASIVVGIFGAIIYIFPFVQLLMANEKGNWLKRHFEKNPPADEAEATFQQQLVKAAAPQLAFPMYKLLKFYLLTTGIIAMVAGLVIIILPEHISGSLGRKIIILIPLFVGIVIYFLYTNLKKGHGIWREIAGFMLLLGIAITGIGAHDIYDMDWLRSDILIYIILTLGLVIIHHLKAIIASYLYLLIIAFAAAFIGSNIGNNWMLFLSHFIWFYAFAILNFWKPRLESAKNIEFPEILFGVFYFGVLISLAINNTSGLSFLAITIVLPYLYLFSKKYYKNTTWFGGKVIEIITVLTVVIGALAFSIDKSVRVANRSIELFEDFSFHRLVAYLILAGIGIIAYTYYTHEREVQKTTNPLIAIAPIAAFLLIYLLNDYGSQFILNIFVLYLGIDYIRRGLQLKDPIRLGLGSLVIPAAFLIRLENFQNYLDERIVVGFIVLFIGGVFFSIAAYIRSKWTVTSPNAEKIMIESENDI